MVPRGQGEGWLMAQQGEPHIAPSLAFFMLEQISSLGAVRPIRFYITGIHFIHVLTGIREELYADELTKLSPSYQPAPLHLS